MAWWCRRHTDQAWRAMGERAGSGKAISNSRRASGTLSGISGASRSSPRAELPPQCLASQLGQERMGQQGQGDVALPAVPAADLVLVQPDLAFAFLKTLLDRPARSSHASQAIQW